MVNMYTRKYVGKDSFLFGRIYRVVARTADAYEVKRTSQAEEFIRRLVIRCPDIPSGAIRVNLETYFDRCEVLEILEHPYNVNEKT